MTSAAMGEFQAMTRIASCLNEVYVLIQYLSARLLPDAGRRAVFVETWMAFVVEEVRDNSGLTHGHTQQHYAGMPWDSCRHCLQRMLGPWEVTALEEAVERMMVMVV